MNKTCITLLCLIAAGCTRTTPADEPPAVEKPRWNSEWVTGIPFHLKPLAWDSKEPRPKPDVVVAKLFAGLAEDEQTKKILARVHDGAEVTFVVRKFSEEEAKTNEPKEPPAKGQAVYWAITKWNPAPVPDDEEKFAPGRQLHLPVYLSWTYMTRLDRGDTKATKILVAVVNDYLLRHDLGYQVRHGILPARLEPMLGDLRPRATIRAELDGKIEELAARK